MKEILRGRQVLVAYLREEAKEGSQRRFREIRAIGGREEVRDWLGTETKTLLKGINGGLRVGRHKMDFQGLFIVVSPEVGVATK